jgi:hypothetical protein
MNSELAAEPIRNLVALVDAPPVGEDASRFIFRLVRYLLMCSR